jgi:hypothetical protein
MYRRMMNHPSNTDPDPLRLKKECAISAAFFQYLASTGPFKSWKEQQDTYEEFMVSFELQFSVFHSHHNLQPKDPIAVWNALQCHDKTYELAQFMKMILTVVVVMDIGYFSYFLSLYLPDKETQRNTYLNPCSEFILNLLDIIYSQMTPIRKQSFLLKLEPLLEPLPFRLCLIQ